MSAPTPTTPVAIYSVQIAEAAKELPKNLEYKVLEGLYNDALNNLSSTSDLDDKKLSKLQGEIEQEIYSKSPLKRFWNNFFLKVFPSFLDDLEKRRGVVLQLVPLSLFQTAQSPETGGNIGLALRLLPQTSFVPKNEWLLYRAEDKDTKTSLAFLAVLVQMFPKDARISLRFYWFSGETLYMTWVTVLRSSSSKPMTSNLEQWKTQVAKFLGEQWTRLDYSYVQDCDQIRTLRFQPDLTVDKRFFLVNFFPSAHVWNESKPELSKEDRGLGLALAPFVKGEAKPLNKVVSLCIEHYLEACNFAEITNIRSITLPLFEFQAPPLSQAKVFVLVYAPWEKFFRTTTAPTGTKDWSFKLEKLPYFEPLLERWKQKKEVKFLHIGLGVTLSQADSSNPVVRHLRFALKYREVSAVDSKDLTTLKLDWVNNLDKLRLWTIGLLEDWSPDVTASTAQPYSPWLISQFDLLIQIVHLGWWNDRFKEGTTPTIPAPAALNSWIQGVAKNSGILFNILLLPLFLLDLRSIQQALSTLPVDSLVISLLPQPFKKLLQLDSKRVSDKTETETSPMPTATSVAFLVPPLAPLVGKSCFFLVPNVRNMFTQEAKADNSWVNVMKIRGESIDDNKTGLRLSLKTLEVAALPDLALASPGFFASNFAKNQILFYHPSTKIEDTKNKKTVDTPLFFLIMSQDTATFAWRGGKTVWENWKDTKTRQEAMAHIQKWYSGFVK